MGQSIQFKIFEYMKLALRHSLPKDASTLHDVSAWAIETRLVSKYAHAGILISETLYHSNGTKGVHAEANPDITGWILVDIGEDCDDRALKLFKKGEGFKYDFFSLGAFVIPVMSDSKRYYCFELCYLMMTGCNPRERVTCEVLILVAMHMGGLLLSPLPAIKSIPMESE